MTFKDRLKLQPIGISYEQTGKDSCLRFVCMLNLFADAQSEIENIKCLISKSFILSWTRELSLAEDTELDIMHTADSAIDKLLSTLSTEVSVYLLINDIIKAAHIHVLRYDCLLWRMVNLPVMLCRSMMGKIGY